MIEGKIKRAERSNRWKAIVITMLFHVLLIGGFVLSGEQGVEKWMPEFVKELLIDQPEASQNASPAA